MCVCMCVCMLSCVCMSVSICVCFVCVHFRAQTSTQVFSEYSNIWLFDYDFEYSNNHLKGNIGHEYNS